METVYYFCWTSMFHFHRIVINDKQLSDQSRLPSFPLVVPYIKGLLGPIRRSVNKRTVGLQSCESKHQNLAKIRTKSNKSKILLFKEMYVTIATSSNTAGIEGHKCAQLSLQNSWDVALTRDTFRS
jgi:translation initiation factor IF-1